MCSMVGQKALADAIRSLAIAWRFVITVGVVTLKGLGCSNVLVLLEALWASFGSVRLASDDKKRRGIAACVAQVMVNEAAVRKDLHAASHAS